MKTLVIAEHDNASLKAATLNAIAAAGVLGGDVDILVAGAGCGAAADAAAQVPLILFKSDSRCGLVRQSGFLSGFITGPSIFQGPR